jgi:excisionase family DNA binding protein
MHYVGMEDELLTVEEAAKRVKMHPVTVRRLLRDGQLPGRKVGTRQWRVSAAALKSYMESGPTLDVPAKKGKR